MILVHDLVKNKKANLGSSWLSLLNAGVIGMNHPLLGSRSGRVRSSASPLTTEQDWDQLCQVSTGNIGPHHYPRLFTSVPEIQIMSSKFFPHPFVETQGLLWPREVSDHLHSLGWPPLPKCWVTVAHKFASFTSLNKIISHLFSRFHYYQGQNMSCFSYLPFCWPG